MEPSRWNSLMTVETTSQAEAIMFASSWCVRRTLRIVPEPFIFPEMLGEVQQQGRKTRGDLPVQEALDDLVGLPQALGEGGEELHSILRTPLYDLGQGGLLGTGHPHVGDGLSEDVLPAALDQAQPAKYPGIPEERGRGLLVVAVDLVQAHRALEQEIELVVGIAGVKNDVLGPEAPLDHTDTRALEIVEAEPVGCRGGREAPGVVPKDLPCPPLFRTQNSNAKLLVIPAEIRSSTGYFLLHSLYSKTFVVLGI